MKQGDEFNCPHCGRNTFLKKVPVMEGWTKKCDALACASCSKIIQELTAEPEKPVEETSAADRLKSLLGGVESEKKVTLTAEKDEKRFCRDCKFMIEHPFLTRCMKWEKEVNPMDDCPSFIPKRK